MDEITEFIAVLDAECDLLKAEEQMLVSVAQPWRYHSDPLDDEPEHDLFWCVLEAGKWTVEAETCAGEGDETGAWRALAKAQQALLKSLSTKGRRIAKKAGNAKGGKRRNEGVRYKIFCIADDLLASDQKWRGLAARVAVELSKLDENKSETVIRKILKEQKHLLVNR